VEAWDFVGTMLLVLGAFLVVGGIGLSIALLVERRWWKKSIDGVMASLGALIPGMQEVMGGMVDRVFLYLRRGALLGGPGLCIVGAVLIIFGAYIICA